MDRKAPASSAAACRSTRRRGLLLAVTGAGLVAGACLAAVATLGQLDAALGSLRVATRAEAADPTQADHTVVADASGSAPALPAVGHCLRRLSVLGLVVALGAGLCVWGWGMARSRRLPAADRSAGATGEGPDARSSK